MVHTREVSSVVEKRIVAHEHIRPVHGLRWPLRYRNLDPAAPVIGSSAKDPAIKCGEEFETVKKLALLKGLGIGQGRGAGVRPGVAGVIAEDPVGVADSFAVESVAALAAGQHVEGLAGVSGGDECLCFGRCRCAAATTCTPERQCEKQENHGLELLDWFGCVHRGLLSLSLAQGFFGFSAFLIISSSGIATKSFGRPAAILERIIADTEAT